MKIPVSYFIEVYVTPEKAKDKASPFFWCIIKCDNGNFSNEGSGWAKDPNTAYRIAYDYYESVISCSH